MCRGEQGRRTRGELPVVLRVRSESTDADGGTVRGYRYLEA